MPKPECFTVERDGFTIICIDGHLSDAALAEVVRLLKERKRSGTTGTIVWAPPVPEFINVGPKWGEA